MKRRMFSSLVAATALLPLRGNAQGPARGQPQAGSLTSDFSHHY